MPQPDTHFTPATALANLLAWNTQIYSNLLAGITEAQANTRYNPETNTFKWIAGHIVADRYWAANKMGIKVQPPAWVKGFYTEDPQDGSSEAVPLSEMLAHFTALSEPFVAGIKAKTEAELLAEGYYEYSFGANLLVHNAAFSAHHETYHLGQLALLRKLAGMGSVNHEV